MSGAEQKKEEFAMSYIKVDRKDFAQLEDILNGLDQSAVVNIFAQYYRDGSLVSTNKMQIEVDEAKYLFRISRDHGVKTIALEY